MIPLVIDFTNLMLSALLVGAMFCVTMVFNPAGLDANRYISLQQNGIRTLHPIMPGLGVVTILATFLAAFLARDIKLRMFMLIVAALCFIAAGLITRFRNQPINAIVKDWNSAEPPEIWTRLRDAWWRWHSLRLTAGLIGLALVIAASLVRCVSQADTETASSVARPLFEALLRVAYLLV
jgi:uncharacterized membrane protein